MRRGALWVAAPLALVLALLAGCGGSGGSDSSQQTAEGSAQEKPQVIVETSAPASTRRRSTAKPRRAWSRSARSSPAAGAPPRARASSSTPTAEIVTNAHVVTDESGGGPRKPAKEVFVEFPDRNVVPANIIGFDPFADVALLEVEARWLQAPPAEARRRQQDLDVGEPVAAIGSPFGEQHSLSVGVVSATDRSVKSLTQFQIEGAIQTDASINPGNSGGPLLDGGARVLGINQQIETNSGANDGVGFAVPISAVKRSVAQLERERQRRIRLHRRLHPAALPAARREARPRHRLRRPDRRSRPRRPRRRRPG